MRAESLGALPGEISRVRAREKSAEAVAAGERPKGRGAKGGRTTEQAISTISAHGREGTRLDISAFFDEANHDLLMERLGLKVRDKRILRLIGAYLRAPLRIEGREEKRSRGTPQGSPPSPPGEPERVDYQASETEGQCQRKWRGPALERPVSGVSDRRGRTDWPLPQEPGAAEGESPGNMECPLERSAGRTHPKLATAHPWLVELLPGERPAGGNPPVGKLDAPTHAEIFLATTAQPPRTAECAAAPERQAVSPETGERLGGDVAQGPQPDVAHRVE